ncbi:helix-turn-helix domain-containing protein [Actinocorallia longicatena]|uniref:HTH tetR-type domain-containing protein n=1 Tax=Actinocorallia longicatena TaxID=111803 RepID=A0ABP6QGU1_9ACTN
MAKQLSDDTEAPAASTRPRRRAGLSQARSRDTRRRLVQTAMRLWTERGFETGIEETTIDEIVEKAGVTKGTFYFHFAHKEEILLELGYQTATVLYEEATRCVNAQRTLEESLRRLVGSLVASVQAAPPAAVGRAMSEFLRPRKPGDEPPASFPSFGQALEILFARAVEVGEVTDAVEPGEMAQIIEALYVDSIMEWSKGRLKHLKPSLQRRTAVVLAGLRPGAAF